MVLKESICIVTAMAIKANKIFTKKRGIKKNMDMSIVIHNILTEIILAFKGIAL